MSEGDFIQLQDQKVGINLETLSSVGFTTPAFRPLADFSISSLIYHGDMSSLFHGKIENTPVIIETCTRIPFRLVCREIKLLNDLNIKNIVQVSALTRNSSLGIISIAYRSFPFQPWTEIVPQINIPSLLFSLLTVVSQLHASNIFHGWICRSSVFVNPDFKSITLGSFHAAAKVGDPAPLVPDHPCAPATVNEVDRRADDVYSAALWFLSFYVQDPRSVARKLDSLSTIDKDLLDIIRQMIDENVEQRITSQDAVKKLQAFLHVSSK